MKCLPQAHELKGMVLSLWHYWEVIEPFRGRGLVGGSQVTGGSVFEGEFGTLPLPVVRR